MFAQLKVMIFFALATVAFGALYAVAQKNANSPVVAGITTQQYFPFGPTDTKNIKFIAPGVVIGADSRFTYIHNKDTKPVTVIAPADGTLIYAAYKNRSDLSPKLSLPDYDFEFQMTSVAKYRINHITKPIAILTTAVPVTKPIATGPGKPLTAAQTTPRVAVKVKAGQVLGTTTGTPGEQNWDFSLFVNNQAVCPYLYMPKGMQAKWLGLLGKDRKIIKGTACTISGEY